MRLGGKARVLVVGDDKARLLVEELGSRKVNPRLPLSADEEYYRQGAASAY